MTPGRNGQGTGAHICAYLLMGLSAVALSACNSDPAGGASPSGSLGVSAPVSPGGGTASSGTGGSGGTAGGSGGTTGGAGGGSGSALISPTCVTSDSSHLCIGIKVVAYQDTSGTPALSQAQAVTVIQGVNDIWKQCNVGFQIEEYDQLDPTTLGLTYGAASENELTQIRQQFADDTTFLFAITGSWNTADIAWTEMPGGGPYGSVIDADYASHPVTVAHEFGHYQGLDHVQTTGDVMYPIVYDTDTTLTSDQCALAVSTDQADWQPMLRH